MEIWSYTGGPDKFVSLNYVHCTNVKDDPSGRWYVRPAKTQTSLRAYSDQNLCKWLEYSMNVQLLAEQHLEILSLKGGCTGWSESIYVIMPHGWKSHVAAHT